MGRIVHQAGAFLVEECTLTDGSKVYNVLAWVDGYAEPMAMFLAKDEQQAARVADNLQSAIVREVA